MYTNYSPKNPLEIKSKIKRKTKLIAAKEYTPENIEALDNELKIGQDCFAVIMNLKWDPKKRKYMHYPENKPMYLGKLIEKSLISRLSHKGDILLYLKGKTALQCWNKERMFSGENKIGYGTSIPSRHVFSTEEAAIAFIEEYNKKLEKC